MCLSFYLRRWVRGSCTTKSYFSFGVLIYELFVDANPEENRDSGSDKTGSRTTTKIEKIYPSCAFIIKRYF